MNLIHKINAATGKKFIGLIKENDLEAGIADKNYVHEQSQVNAIWEVEHNLNKQPSVSVIDSNGYDIDCEIARIDNNHLHLLFNSATSGRAYLN